MLHVHFIDGQPHITYSRRYDCTNIGDVEEMLEFTFLTQIPTNRKRSSGKQATGKQANNQMPIEPVNTIMANTRLPTIAQVNDKAPIELAKGKLVNVKLVNCKLVNGKLVYGNLANGILANNHMPIKPASSKMTKGKLATIEQVNDKAPVELTTDKLMNNKMVTGKQAIGYTTTEEVAGKASTEQVPIQGANDELVNGGLTTDKQANIEHASEGKATREAPADTAQARANNSFVGSLLGLARTLLYELGLISNARNTRAIEDAGVVARCQRYHRCSYSYLDVHSCTTLFVRLKN